MARTFAYLYGFGGLLVATSLILPGTSERDALWIGAVAAVAFAVAAFCLWQGGHLPVSFFRALPLFGAMLIAILLFAGGPTGSGAFALLFFWVTVSAFYFFHPLYGAFCTAFASAGYLAVLLSRPDSALLLDWVLMTGALFVVGLLVGRLRSRVELLLKELANAAQTDPLTGLRNRREYQSRLRDEIRRADRTGQHLSVLALDLDALKAINDDQGHDAGDRALIRVSATLDSEVRAVDTLARMGGDEFAVVLGGSDKTGARLVADRLRRAVAEEFRDDSMSLTLSAGVAGYPADGDTFEALQVAADQALYRAKRAGGDRSLLFSDPVAPTPE